MLKDNQDKYGLPHPQKRNDLVKTSQKTHMKSPSQTTKSTQSTCPYCNMNRWFTGWTVSQGSSTEWPSAKMIEWTSTLWCGSIRLRGLSSGRKKQPKRRPLRALYWDPKLCFQDHMEAGSMILMARKLKEFVDEWAGMTQDPFMLGMV